jgi:hypothetical protein
LHEALVPETEPYNLFSAFLLYFGSLICIAIGSLLILLSFTAMANTIKKTLLESGELSDWLKGAIFLNILLLILYLSFGALAWFNIAGIINFSGYYPTYNFLINTFYLFPLSGAGTGTFFFQNTPLCFFIAACIVNIVFISIMTQKSRNKGNNNPRSGWLNVPMAILLNLLLIVAYIGLDDFAWYNMTNGHTISSHYGLWVSSFTVNYGDTLTYTNIPLLIFILTLILNGLIVIKANKQFSINRF